MTDTSEKRVLSILVYDKDKEKILHFYQSGVPSRKITTTHLGYGNYLSLKAFIDKSKPGA